MNELERQIWAAAFVAEFSRHRRLFHETACARTVDDISGYSCAELADVAVEKFREAMASSSAEYLLPMEESWPQ